MRKLSCLFALLFFAAVTNAQLRQISGKVTSKSSGSPLQGVTVQSGKSLTITDAAGAYSLQAQTGDSLMFTSVGMKSFSLLIDQKNNYTVEMEENQQGLGEVIVVGYTSQRKQDLTGAIAVVDMAPVKNNSSGNVMQALQEGLPVYTLKKMDHLMERTAGY